LAKPMKNSEKVFGSGVRGFRHGAWGDSGCVKKKKKKPSSMRKKKKVVVLSGEGQALFYMFNRPVRGERD